MIRTGHHRAPALKVSEEAPFPAPETRSPRPHPRFSTDGLRPRKTDAMNSEAVAEPGGGIRLRVDAARKGDEQALETVIRSYQDRIARFIVSIVGRDADYEDLCQLTFVKMSLALPKLRSVDIFEGWLFRIARNVCMDHLRRLKWRRVFVPFTREHEEVPLEEPDDPGRYRAFEAALVELPSDQRELIALLRERDWSYAQLAEITGSTVSAVGTRLFRARSNLRKILKESRS